MNTYYVSPVHVMLNYEIYRELEDYLIEVRHPALPEQVVGEAVRQWLASARRRAADAQQTLLKGYLWKDLFLPDGTRLRTEVGGTAYYATVSGDRIVSGDAPVSPHQFANGFGKRGRNAWKSIHVLLPYETHWRVAAASRPRPVVRPAAIAN